jgi:PKD repeat protein
MTILGTIPAFIEKYNENVRTGAYYKTKLAVGEEGFFISSAKGGKEPYTYEWKFSDGVTLNTANATRSFDSVGRYYFDLIVTDVNDKQAKSTAMYIDVLQELPKEETTNSTLIQGQ